MAAFWENGCKGTQIFRCIDTVFVDENSQTNQLTFMRAKKSYGQHFLTDEEIAGRIAGSLTLDGHTQVLEIGPGKGFLTKYLLEKNIKLLAVEADTDMVEYLQRHFPQLQGKIIADDFLQLDMALVFPANGQSANASPFSIIGNFPYNISSQIVFKMLDHRERVPELVGMFQKEMAERIVAPPGNKDYGIISVLTQAHYTGEYLFSVGNQHFNPPPKVQSGVIRLRRKDEPLGCDPLLFKTLVKQAFSQRRKMLRNTLKPFFKNEELMDDPYFTKRPETLSVAAFVDLTNRL